MDENIVLMGFFALVFFFTVVSLDFLDDSGLISVAPVGLGVGTDSGGQLQGNLFGGQTANGKELLVIGARNGVFSEAIAEGAKAAFEDSPPIEYVYKKWPGSATAEYYFTLENDDEYFVFFDFVDMGEIGHPLKVTLDEEKDFVFVFNNTEYLGRTKESLGFLKAGSHSLEITFIVPETKLSRILITNDPNDSYNQLSLAKFEAEAAIELQGFDVVEENTASEGKMLASRPDDSNAVIAVTVNVPWLRPESHLFVRIQPQNPEAFDLNKKVNVKVRVDDGEEIDCFFKPKQEWWDVWLRRYDTRPCINLLRGEHKVSLNFGEAPINVDAVVLTNLCWDSCGTTEYARSCTTAKGIEGISFCTTDQYPKGKVQWTECRPCWENYLSIREITNQ